MRQKFELEKIKAIRIKVEIDGDVQRYAKSFLAIYNNVKNDHDLLKCYNDYGNGVYVVCTKEVKGAAIEFLEQFGKIVRVEDVECVRPLLTWYELREDMDTEFLEIEE